MYELPWAGPWPWSPRCRAVHEPRINTQHPDAAFPISPGFYGRCELAPHGPEIDHALERGFHCPRWSTRWTGEGDVVL